MFICILFYQNNSIISSCNVDGDCKDDLAHVSPDHAWNDLYTPPMFDSAGDSYLIVLPTFQGPRGYFKVRSFIISLLLWN